MRAISGTCPLCQRHTQLTFHHLIPRKVHKRNFFAKSYSREQLNRGINICRPCNNGIHRCFDEMMLAKHYNRLEDLQAAPELAKHFSWVAKQRTAD